MDVGSIAMLILGDLDISSLLKANNKFTEILQQPENEIVRDAAIQRFEFTYELVWKTLRKILIKRGVEVNSPETVFRQAANDWIIDQLELWFNFIEYRNNTSHVYNENISKEIYQQLPKFLQLTSNFINKLISDEFKI